MSHFEGSQKLLISDHDPRALPASKRIPAIAVPFVSERAKKTLDIVERFLEEDSVPADAVMAA